ncbi:MAG: hypothetical protein BWY76_02824 [bacterium ADurb.Bin429]|nr:MAG: hypothetical protein BWY76_02824 [bacterium ADurb.Bin429]
MRSCMGICLALLCVALGGYCGQMSSHVYTALQAKDGLTGAAAAVVTAREDAYLAGAQGPDVVGVVMPGLDKLSGWNSAGTESHYHPKKAELALNLLEAAGTDPAARAYAIGWISHYVNDIHVHELVNRYGGYYAVDETQHKVLEQLETKHVLVAHADVVTKARAEQNYAALGDTFAAFIINAYRATFPENALYKIENTNYFCRRFNEAAGYCTDAHKVFYATATTKAKNGNHGWGMATLKFPNMPTFDDYELMLRGMEITDVKPGKDRLTAVVKMHDTKCYGRFLADWEMAANAAIARTRAVYGLISAYLDATDPAVRAAARAVAGGHSRAES